MDSFGEIIKYINDYGTLPVLVFVCYIAYRLFRSEKERAENCIEERLREVKEHSEDSKALLQTSLQAMAEMKTASERVASLVEDVKNLIQR